MSRKISAKHIAAPIVAVALAVVATMALTGCGMPKIVKNSTPPALGQSTLEAGTTLNEGKLLVGINASNAPFGGMNNESQIVGLDADIAAALGDELGLKVELVDVGTKGRGAISSEMVDVVLGATKTSANSEITYSDAYLNNGTCLYCLNENLPSSIKDVDLKDKDVIVVTGTDSASTIEGVLKADQIVECDTVEAAFDALTQEQAPFLAIDAAAGDYIARGYDNVSRVDFISAADVLPVYALTSKDNPGLSVAVNNALKNIVSNGTMQVILSKWLGLQGYTLLPGQVDLDALPEKFEKADEQEAEAGNAAGANGAAATTGTAGADATVTVDEDAGAANN